MTKEFTNKLKFIGLCLGYTLMLILLSAAWQVTTEKTGKAQLSFAYRVF